jgi:hypothetical protein
MATGRVPTTANSPLTAKGDLFGYSTTQARVAVGSDGDTLVADSAATTGLRWTATPSASNPVLNASMDIWQRGTSFASDAGIYTADRWLIYRNVTSSTISRQATGDTTNLPNIQYCMRFQRNNGTTSTSTSYISQSFESVNSIPYAGKTVTLSFYARAGANFSAASSQIQAKLSTGTGTDQNVITGTYTGIATPLNQTATLTTTWQRFSNTGTLSASLTELAIYFEWASVGTAGAADYVEITGVQLDIGNVALPYRRNSGTIQGELAACQRYYWRNTNGASTGIFASGGVAFSTTQGIVPVVMPVPMRITPTSLDTTGTASNYRLYNGSINTALSAVPTIAAGDSTPNVVMLNVTVASGVTAGSNFQLSANSSSTAYLGFGAEL